MQWSGLVTRLRRLSPHVATIQYSSWVTCRVTSLVYGGFGLPKPFPPRHPYLVNYNAELSSVVGSVVKEPGGVKPDWFFSCGCDLRALRFSLVNYLCKHRSN